MLSDLQVGDTAYAVYCINTNTNESEYIIETCTVLKNQFEEREIDISDIYDAKPIYQTLEEYRFGIRLNEHFTDVHYETYYSKTQNKRCFTMIFPRYRENGPELTIFANKQDAVKHVLFYMDIETKHLKEDIEKQQARLEFLNQKRKQYDEIQNCD